MKHTKNTTKKIAGNTLIDMGSYWLELERCNTWDKQRFSKHEAELAMISLDSCYFAHNCEHCSDCSHCINCSYCYDVQFSRYCSHCERSSHLVSCENCANLKFASYERDLQK